MRPTEVPLRFGMTEDGRLLAIEEAAGGSAFSIEHYEPGEAFVVTLADFLQEQVFDQREATRGEARPAAPRAPPHARRGRARRPRVVDVPGDQPAGGEVRRVRGAFQTNDRPAGAEPPPVVLVVGIPRLVERSERTITIVPGRPHLRKPVPGYPETVLRSALLTVGMVLAFAAPAAADSLTFASEDGDWVGAGLARTFTAADSTFSVDVERNEIEIHVDPVDHRASGWTLRIGGPDGGLPVPGHLLARREDQRTRRGAS